MNAILRSNISEEIPLSPEPTIGRHILTPNRSVYMTFVCPNCLISNLIKFTGTFRDPTGIKFGNEEEWQLMVVLRETCRVVPEASNIRSMDDLSLLMTQNPDVFKQIRKTAAEAASVPAAQVAFFIT